MDLYSKLLIEAKSLASADCESQFGGEIEQDFASFILKIEESKLNKEQEENLLKIISK